MTGLLEVREKLRFFYGKYEIYVAAAIRFFLGIVVFLAGFLTLLPLTFFLFAGGFFPVSKSMFSVSFSCFYSAFMLPKFIPRRFLLTLPA